MKIILSVFADILNYFNPRKKRGAIRLVVLAIVLFVGGRFFLGGSADAVDETEIPPPTVEIATVSGFSGEASFTVIGSVEAIDQANVESEVSGRVTRVNVSLGDIVGAGTIIAQLENASQQAAVLQAEGAYEAALAAAAQSDVGVSSAQTSLSSAENDAVSAFRSAYTSVSSVIYNNIDTIYSNPNQGINGVRIDGAGQTTYLNETRTTLRTTLPAWQQKASTLSRTDDLELAIVEARTNVTSVLVLVDTVISILTRDAKDYENTEFSSLRAILISDRTALNNTLASLNKASSDLTQAKDTLARAELGGTVSDVSSANAQVKQALGSLRAAQANFAKTIIRTPIAGVINSLEVDAGDYIGARSPVAIIANNNALEITAFVGERDRDRIQAGQKVVIEDQYEGTITTIAPALNPQTKKVEIKIQTESSELSNGDTVRVKVSSELRENTANTPVVSPLLVPLTAVKFTASAGSMFIVIDNKLVSVPVEIGPISGSFVEITYGIDTATEFVVDARGLTEGLVVEPVTK